MSITNKNGLEGFWLYCHDHCRTLTQMYNFGDKNLSHLSGGVMSVFAFQSIAMLKHPL